MPSYRGHRSWNAWNVCLWLHNNEWLYQWSVDLVRRYGKDKAARIMASELEGQRTPDGDNFNYTCIREALRGME